MVAPGRPRALPDRLRGLAQRLAESDLPDLWQFQQTHFGATSRQADPVCFAWRFGRHPLLLAAADRQMPFWLCRRDGRVVGQQAGLPLPLQAGERRVDAAWAIDLMVEPEWRLRGIAPALGEALADSVPLLCGLNISDAAHKAFRRAGWLDLGCVARMARLIRPLVAGQAPFGSQIATPAEALLSRWAAPLLSVGDAILLPALRAGSRWEPVGAFDERADAVWRRSAPHYPLLARRDFSLLRWRFDYAPHAAVYHRHYLIRRGEPVGYAVTRMRGRSLVVVDYLCAPQDVIALFAHILTDARRCGAVLLVCLAQPPAIRHRLRAFGFIRQSGPRFMVHPGPDLPELPGLSDPAAWFLTDGDSDLDHG